MSTLRVNIDGKEMNASANCSILEALIHAGHPLSMGVGCMGQGVCGSCRVFIRRAGSSTVETAMACNTPVEEGMQVSSLDYPMPRAAHPYTLQVNDGWQHMQWLDQVFPEASHCRHCGGCDRACPQGLEVEKGVNAAASGQIFTALEVFEECIMCDLCSVGCPEQIEPNHLGLFVRRAVAANTLRPADLMRRVREIEQGEHTIDFNAPGAQAPKGAA